MVRRPAPAPPTPDQGARLSGSDRLVTAGKAMLFVLAVLPLAAYPGFVFPAAVSKGILLRLVGLALAGTLLVAATRRSVSMRTRDPIALSLIALLAATSLAAALGVAPLRSLYGTMQRMGGVLTLASLVVFYVALRTFLDEKDWRNLLRSALLLSGFACVWALVAGRFGGERVGTFGNASFIAIFAVMTVSLAALVAATSPPPWILASGVAAVAAVGTLTQAGERAAVMALVAGWAAAGIVYLLLRLPPAHRRYTTWGAALGLAGLLTAALLLARGSGAGGWWEGLRSDPGMVIRLIFWKAALESFTGNPFLGIGPDNFTVAFSQHFDPAIYPFREGQVDRAHNAYLEILVASGIVGVGALAALGWSVMRTLGVAWRAATLKPGEVAALTAAFTGYALYLTVWFPDPSSLLLLLMMAAFTGHRAARGLRFLEILPASTRAPGLRTPILALSLTLLAWMAVRHVALVGLAASAARGAATGTLEDRLGAYDRALGYRVPEGTELVSRVVRDIPLLAPDPAAARRDARTAEAVHDGVQAAFSTLARAISQDPLNDLWRLQRASLLTYAAGFYGDRRYLDQAIADMTVAVELAPRRLRHYHVLSELYVIGGNPREALVVLDRALALESGFGETWDFRATALMAAGDPGGALDAMNRAVAGNYRPRSGSLRALVAALETGGRYRDAALLGERFLATWYPGVDALLVAANAGDIAPLEVARDLPKLYLLSGDARGAAAAAARWPAQRLQPAGRGSAGGL